MVHRAALSSLVAVVLSLAARVSDAQLPPIQYAYDELDRLVAVVDPQGNTAIYVYDAVGNIVAIRRVDAATLPAAVAITAVVPERGKAGTVVSILGKGFGPTADQNAISFNGAAASATRASGNRLVTTVPAGATSGPITVTAPLGSAVSPRPFQVIGALAVVPPAVTLGVAATQAFVATDGMAETSRVVWAVEGVVGGDAHVGTISAEGLYTAPATIATARTVRVTAASMDDVSVVAAATVTLRPPVPAFLAAIPLGVRVDPGPRVLTAAAVAIQPAEQGLRPFVAGSVGVQRPPEADGIGVVAGGVGVSPPTPGVFTGVSHVSLGREPLIASITPASAARGTANLTLTLLGSGLSGLLGLDVLLNNTVDPNVTVANPTATPDGSEVTAQISIAAGAALGPRVVRVRAAAGTSTSVGAGGNVFTVQ